MTKRSEPIDPTLVLRLYRQQEALFAIGQLWRRYEGDLKSLFRATTEIIARTLNIERVSVWRYESGTRSILCEDLYEATPGRHSEGLHLNAEHHPAYFMAMETEEVIIAEDAITDPRTFEFAEAYLKPLVLAQRWTPQYAPVGRFTVCSAMSISAQREYFMPMKSIRPRIWPI